MRDFIQSVMGKYDFSEDMYAKPHSRDSCPTRLATEAAAPNTKSQPIQITSSVQRGVAGEYQAPGPTIEPRF